MTNPDSRPLLLPFAIALLSLSGCITGEIGDSSDSGSGAEGGGSSAGGSALGAGGGWGGSGGAGAEGGAAPACTTPQDCPGIDGDCSRRTCHGGECGSESMPAGAPCSEGEGQLCDGSGLCVECLQGTDCSAGICQQSQCVPAGCGDGVENGDETDVDCGGSCAPCSNGLGCQAAGDCTSGYCDAGSCAACSSASHCASSQYCGGGKCKSKKSNGASCSSGGQCQSGKCPSQDGVCCSSACGGTCRSCLGSKTGGQNGTCAPIVAQTDPDGECPDQGASSCGSNGNGCNGSNSSPGCILYSANTTCSPASCSSGQQTTAGKCNGSGSCQSGSTSSCSPYVCGSSACKTSCSSNSHCTSGYECSGGNCVVAQVCQGAGPSTTGLDSQEQSMLQLINNHRQSHGKSPLSPCTSLNRAAQGHSEDMRDNNYFSHTGLNGSSFSERSCWACYQLACGPSTYVGENLAAGYSGASATFNQWLNSPGHNANMLNGNFKVIGIGRATGGGTYGSYWTTNFGGASESSCN